MDDVQLLTGSGQALTALKPGRARMLALLGTPRSAAEVAKELDLPRQKVNYHLRALEGASLVQVADTRAWGGITERKLVATARGYLVGPSTLGAAAPDPSTSTNRLSAQYLLALAGRALTEVGRLLTKAAEQGRTVATLSLDTEIRFANAQARAAFSRELVAGVTELAQRYHAPQGRLHRVLALAHPIPDTTEQTT